MVWSLNANGRTYNLTPLGNRKTKRLMKL